MNEVFIIGKVITEVKFDFILNSKHISVARLRVITVCDEQEIEIMTYDEMADYVYANLKHEDVVMINGYLEYGKVILGDIQIINKDKKLYYQIT